MALESVLEALPISFTTFFFAAAFSSIISYIVYRSYLDPLSSVPGPLICRLTDTWIWYLSYVGKEARVLDGYHEKYGPVVRIGPHNVSISDGKALAPIYIEKGGFLKAPCYANFDFEGHPTIFSALDPKHRSVRSKAVLPLFSTGSIRASNDTLENCVQNFVRRLQEAKEESQRTAKETGQPKPVNVQNLSRGLAIDTVCSYLYGEDYEGLAEVGKSKLSASEYVDSVVAFGRLFYLPSYLFNPAFSLYHWLYPSERGSESAEKIDKFTSNLVAKAASKDEPPAYQSTYQSRLLAAGISERETSLQMQDVIFAGTDTTGTNTANILWNLAKHPKIHERLRKEIEEAEDSDPNYNPHSHQYLDAVIREGLRTSLANATRLPRQVPPSGWTFTPTSSTPSKTYTFPGGTIVGIQPYSLHLNPHIFPNPRKFRPERWLPENKPTPEMYRDYFPFGLGSRQCIARNLASSELVLAIRAIAKSNVLEGARVVKDRLEIMEWFNARIVGERIDLVWD